MDFVLSTGICCWRAERYKLFLMFPFLLQVLQSTIYEVDLDRILQSIHVYLQELGMEEIRRR